MIPKYHKDLLWAKEITALVFIMLFSLLFKNDFAHEGIWFGLVLACFVLYQLARFEERKYSLLSPLHLYFCQTSSYFVVSAFFFTAGYFLYKAFMPGWLELFASLGIVLFAVGLARILFSKAMRPFHINL